MSKKQLEYARKMTKKEVDDFYSFIKKKQDDKIEVAQKSLETHADELIREYHLFAKNIDIQYKGLKASVRKAREHFKNRTCECGLKLKEFTNSYNGQKFWGCPDYRNESVVHKAWNYEPGEDFKPLFKNWLTTIITNVGLRGKLHTKYLMIFYEANNLPDLQLEYVGLDSKELIDRYTNINKGSKAFELRQVEFLRNQWPNVIYQFPVKYKYVGEKEACCFIDILCSNDDTICIYECKTSQYNIDNEQMTKYVDCIKYINDSLKINKKLTIDYITEN